MAVSVLINELVAVLRAEGYEIRGKVNSEEIPPPIKNDGYGSGRPQRPDVIAFDPAKYRIVFGVVRESRESLDSEESLEQYNVLLDHNASRGDRASILYVLIPGGTEAEFTALVTHYVHREYWHRIIPVTSRGSDR